MSDLTLLDSAWAIVEVLGHRRYAGMVRWEQVGLDHFLRVSIPATSQAAAFEKCFHAKAIFAMTVVPQDVAEAEAEMLAVPQFDRLGSVAQPTS